LEVGTKSATPFLEGLAKARKVEERPFSFSSLFLPSAALGLNENQGRIGMPAKKMVAKMNTNEMLISASPTMKKALTHQSLLGQRTKHVLPTASKVVKAIQKQPAYLES
jgi:hypothetical protein